MTFGENLKTLRNARSISQKDLAVELGFSFQNVSKWERNESLPDIETLIEIAKYFATTTDALLGFASEVKFSTIEIDKNEVVIYQTYPETETLVTGKMVFAIDSESKIAGTVFIPYIRAYRTGYIRNEYEPLAEQSTLIYEHTYRSRGRNIVDNKRIKIPENGFLIAVSDNTFAAKKIMKFITPEEYDAFLEALIHAEEAEVHGFEDKNVFEGCMPVEVMARRGFETLRYGPLKPVGLTDPKTGREPYAVVQLRQDNAAKSVFNLVGFQTHLKFGEQKRVFSMIPALHNAEFLRYGVMHRNTFMNSPGLLSPDYSPQSSGCFRGPDDRRGGLCGVHSLRLPGSRCHGSKAPGQAHSRIPQNYRHRRSGTIYQRRIH